MLYREFARQREDLWVDRFLIEDSKEKIEEVLKKYPEDGLFLSTFAIDTDEKPEDVSLAFDSLQKTGDLFFDFDSPDLYLAQQDCIKTYDHITRILGTPEDAVRIYYSGSKGFHLLVQWACLGLPGPRPDLPHLYRRFADGVARHVSTNKTLDLKIYNARRLFRVPGSVHQGTHRKKVLVDHTALREGPFRGGESDAEPHVEQWPTDAPRVASLLSVTLRNLDTSERERQERRQRLPRDFLTKRLDCVQSVLDNGVEEGMRNDTVYTLSLYFKALGLDKKETYTIIESSAIKEKNNLDLREAARTITSAYESNRRFGLRNNSALEPYLSEKDIERWDSAKIEEEYESIADVARGFVQDLETASSGVVGRYYVDPLDTRIGGIIGGELVVLGGTTGTGKSEFAFHVAYENAKRGIPAAFITLELANRDFVGRLLRSRAGVPAERFWSGDLQDGEKQRILEHAQALEVENVPLFFRKKKSGLTVPELESLVQSLIVEERCRLIVIDHLHYMSAETEDGSENQRVSKSIRAINTLCVKYGVGIIVVAHFRKQQDEFHRPTLHEFRDTSSIEQEASTVLIMWRHMNGIGEEQNVTEFRLAKSRKDLQLGTIKTRFVKDTRTYEPV